MIEKHFPGARVRAAWKRDVDSNVTVLERGRVKRMVRECDWCELRAGCTAPVPMSLPTRATFAVIGEGPGGVEDAQGKPFVGPSGRLLRRVMGINGIDHQRDVAWMNVVSCWPNAHGGTFAPGEAHARACRLNLMEQLRVANVRYVLLVGATALRAFRGDLQVTRAHGKVFVWRATWAVMPVIHPAAALRDKALEPLIERDVAKWAEVVRGHAEMKWLGELSKECTRCGERAEKWDRDAVGYCARHWEQWGEKTWKKMNERWRKDEEPRKEQRKMWD